MANLPSTDRKTLTPIIFSGFMTMIIRLVVFIFPFLVACVGLEIIPLMLIISIIVWYTGYLINECQCQFSKSCVRERVYANFIDLGKTPIKWKEEWIMKIAVASSVFFDIFYLIFCAQVSKDLFNNSIQLDDRVWMLL